MTDRPQCVACDASNSLEHIGHGWWNCSCCSALVLFDGDGRIVRVLLHGHEVNVRRSVPELR